MVYSAKADDLSVEWPAMSHVPEPCAAFMTKLDGCRLERTFCMVIPTTSYL